VLERERHKDKGKDAGNAVECPGQQHTGSSSSSSRSIRAGLYSPPPKTHTWCLCGAAYCVCWGCDSSSSSYGRCRISSTGVIETAQPVHLLLLLLLLGHLVCQVEVLSHWSHFVFTLDTWQQPQGPNLQAFIIFYHGIIVIL